MYEYITRGVCCKKITFDLDDGIVKNIKFLGGCDGNLKAISKLCDGKKAIDIISILKGNICVGKSTSCADQFALALESKLREEI